MSSHSEDCNKQMSEGHVGLLGLRAPGYDEFSRVLGKN